MRAPLKNSLPSTQHGFTIVELMVALVISLLLSIAIYGIFIQSENQQRRSGDTGDMWQQSRIAMAMIERDVRNAGYGMDTGGCSQVLAYDQRLGATGSYYTAYSIESSPQSNPDYDPSTTAGINTQRITLRMGSSEYGASPVATIINTPSSTAATFSVSNSAMVNQKDLLLIKLPTGVCALVQKTDPTSTTPNAPGGVEHSPKPANAKMGYYNTSGGLADLGQNASPSVTITAEDMNNASVFNLGQDQNTVTYYISDNSTVTGGTTSIPTLMASTLDATGGSPSTQPVARGIVDLQFQYGYAADSNSADVSSYGPWDASKVNLIRTVRAALLARADLPDKNYTSPATYDLLGSTYTVPTSGGAGCVNGNCRLYRHLLLVTEIPVRNLIWGR